MSSPSYNVTTNQNLIEWLSLYNAFVDDYDTFGVKSTGNTGSILTPVGTEAERDGSPSIIGSLRFNSDVNLFEYYNGSEWKYISSLDAYFDTLDITSTTYNVNGNVSEIEYTSGHKQTFVYTGSTKIDITYYNTDGITELAVNTLNFDVNGNLTTTSWS